MVTFLSFTEDQLLLKNIFSSTGDPDSDFMFSAPNNMTISLSTAKPLDYEKISFYPLTIRATNLEEPSASGKPGPYIYDFQVNVTVININDNAPEFGREVFVEQLPEDFTVTDMVATITATDKDSDNLTYTMFSNISTPYFAINSTTGVVVLKAEIDRETIDHHSLFIVAFDGIHKVVTELLLVVTDVNDNNPTFVDSSTIIYVSEATYVPHVFVKATATDPDLDNNSTLSYSIVSGNEDGKFSINPESGNLTIISSLDYEKAKIYVLNISATDQGTPYTLSSLHNFTVTVVVVDSNDNNPIFEKSLYQTTISELYPVNDVVISVKAIDSDGTAMHNNVTYTIVDPEARQFFDILTNGSIILNKQLDYNKNTEFRFALQSNDGVHNTSRYMMTTVTIKITDENNKAPVIQPTIYNITISEGTSVGTSIGHVNATDEDTVGRLMFSVLGDSASNFLIGQWSGDIVLKETIDYENPADRLISFTIECSDGVAQTTATVNVIVTDLNDNEPIFGQQYYTGYVNENALAGSSILFVSANDSDALNSNESTIRYSIETDPSNWSTSLFNVDEITGKITVKSNYSIDYELQKKHQFKVIATDMGNVFQLSGYCSVVIYVNDLNDNDPDMLSGKQTVRVKETHLVDQPVVAFMAYDNDTEKSLTYHIVSGNARNTFKINEMYLELNNSLDYESQSNYTLTILARDTDGKESSVAVVDVLVVKVNEFRPQFTSSYIRKEIYENSGLNVIVDLNATDQDSPVSNLLYTLMNTTDFEINPVSGVISNTIELDYERHKSYSLVVGVSDQDNPYLQSFALVDIIVLNQNDEVPHFNPLEIRIKISEKAPADMIIATLTAYDNDTDINDLFFGVGALDPHFHLDNSTGVITLTQQIDVEDPDFSPNYILNFYVSDGVNQSPVNATVKVSVVDVNDNEPTFFKDEYVVYVNESISVNTKIVKVLADDKDNSVINSNIVYTIVSGDSSGNFTFGNGAEDNSIYNTQLFDYESVKMYDLMVEANNSMSLDHLTARALVRVHILDVNDNPPVPDRSDIILNISESTSIGSLVAVIHATDADSGANGELTYSLSNNTVFTIGSTTGEIRTKKTLDHFTQSHHLLVTVTDNGEPQLIATINVTVFINQVPTNIILADVLEYSIYENVAIGYSVLTMNVTSRSGPITYELIASADSSSFNLNEATGEVTTSATFDYDNGKRFYLFQVAVKDPAANVTGRTQVLVTLLDVNDNDPVLTSLLLVYNITEATRINSVIASIDSTDMDDGNNGIVDISAISGDGIGVFAVNTNGYITLNGSLDYRIKNQYMLLIKGQDNGSPPRHTNITITINIFKANVDANVLVFNQSYYYKCINENSVYEEFMTIKAISQNSVPETSVIYTFSTDTLLDVTEKFSLNNTTGTLSTKISLDYEMQREYEIVVVATNSEGYRDTSVVEVCVNDLDDNPYRFKERNITLNLTESTPVGTMIYRLVVLDNDTIDSTDSRSFSVDNGIVSVDNRGFVYLQSGLNYEIAKQHVTQVIVKYITRNDDVATINVNVLDWNDNRPKFSQPLVEFSVYENASIGEMIWRVNASDNDNTSANNFITYTLISASERFEVLANGTIMVKTDLHLTYPNDTTHELVIKATDSGYLNLVSTIDVLITIIDVNNNNPVFEMTNYANVISEEAPVGSTVIWVRATDGDFATGNVVSYHLHDPTNTFTIDRHTGSITLNRPLDYESIQNYTMHVQAVDDGGLTSVNNATIVINLIDVNNNIPTFTLDRYVVNVTENSTIGTTLITIQAIDADATNNTLTYDIVNNDNSSSFVMFGRDVRLAGELDYETQKVFSFLVEATDSATNQLYGRSLVVVNVLDVNDQNPVFILPTPYNVYISEDHPINTFVIDVSAADRDSDPTLMYSIQSGADGKFSMNNTNNRGHITLTQSLDYDVKNLYMMQCIVSDGVNTAVTTVRVYISPVAKPQPTFNETVYVANIHENTTINTTILKVNFHRTILPITSLMFTEAEGNNNFHLTTDGTIRSKVTFDYAVKSQYVFTVTLIDKRSRQAHTTVIVNILDSNDICPVVTPKTQTVHITEPTEDNTIVAVVRASDKDSSSLTFTLHNTTDNVLNSKFKIDQHGGIRADGRIDIENKTIASLMVLVSDGICSENASVFVHVNPVTACPVCQTYRFTEPVYMANIKENSIQNGLLTVVSNRNGNTSYSFEDVLAKAHVTIDNKTGIYSF